MGLAVEPKATGGTDGLMWQCSATGLISTFSAYLVIEPLWKMMMMMMCKVQ